MADLSRICRRGIMASAACIGWAHGGYLVFLRLLELVVGADKAPPLAAATLPRVAIILGVYNEERMLGQRLENLLAIAYPKDLLDIVVASDGSTDDTNRIASEYAAHGVRLLTFPDRRGRGLVTNDAVAEVDADWILFTDAGSRMERDFLLRLAPHFQDASVGVVDGSMICANEGETGVARDVGLYWRFESALKRAETQVGCLASTFGACTAVRREIFRPLGPTEDIDFTTPLDAIAQGYRVVHEPAAVVYEVTHGGAGEQYRARVRMVTKNLPGTLDKIPELRGRPDVVLGLVSHKLLRWLTPFFLVALFLFSLTLRRTPRFRALLGGQTLFYVAAGVGALAERRGKRIAVASTAYSFALANCGFFVGVLNAARGRKITTWQPHQPSDGGNGYER